MRTDWTDYIPSGTWKRVGDTVTITIDTGVRFDHPKGCNHNWKNYVGFKEAYKYCTKCPEKRNLDEQ